MDQRLAELKAWLEQVLVKFAEFDGDQWSLEPVSGDASFRRYFRALSGGQSWIAVDAPPEKEDSRPFVDVARALEAQGISVPHIYEADLEQGFMLLSDFGDQLYLPQLNPATVDRLYADALSTLLQMKDCQPRPGQPLPDYDEALLQREVELFRDWFLQQLLGISMTPEQKHLVDLLFNYLIDAALEQPRVFVHRDYHSRNLMYREGLPPGIIDFQDAVKGPVTYDLVSLLRDCYIDWPEEQVYAWVDDYRQALIAQGQMMPDVGHFRRWFDLMGAQRHCKAIGIFARLHIRDGKSGYLEDIPRTLNYLITVCGRYESLKPVGGWLVMEVLPAMRRSDYFADDLLTEWTTL
ncbi:aminoglycoside phosphotransferase family protein [Neptuniibacter halophilus]|uniref:aminoglycoside phosphotransferase family protein n=1 Tax=Neptuniibacter halophilus TaxID=651666 RepID=UPI002573E549|nr:phosphotransferase [Neptuniibacter halophilus]